MPVKKILFYQINNEVDIVFPEKDQEICNFYPSNRMSDYTI